MSRSRPGQDLTAKDNHHTRGALRPTTGRTTRSSVLTGAESVRRLVGQAHVARNPPSGVGPFPQVKLKIEARNTT